MNTHVKPTDNVSSDLSRRSFLVGTSATAGLALGRYRNAEGRSYQDFLFSLARAMGQDDVSSFGDGGSTLVDELFA